MSRTVEAAREIDVNWCNQEGVLDEPGQFGVFRWRRDGEETASVGYTYTAPDGDERLTLSYTVTPHIGEPRGVAYAVPVEWTPCHFGGARPWFRCPVCDDRVATVYRDPRRDEFACRECQGLIYESQTYTSPMAAAYQRLDDARERIHEGDLSREALREYYDAQRGVAGVFNDAVSALDDEYGREGDNRIRHLPPFEEWLDDLWHRRLGVPGGRSYGWHGRCEATAKTTGERCRQPATGEHGKCYYHGGPGAS